MEQVELAVEADRLDQRAVTTHEARLVPLSVPGGRDHHRQIDIRVARDLFELALVRGDD